ncbi:hypothetical protein QTP70_008494 [Hemibagrus guttatus]|uniref:ribonuclease H n=1 Tax=Hemibagrus guttatus TaxID=175788 RepID=A0AAE0R0I4_9TELE|nr:hypothetical protein QTP70_008494 [Hemibagrus guttatus]
MNSTVPTAESFRFLGTTISQDLKWDTYIDSIIKKAQQRLYFLRQLRKFNLPQELLIQLYSAVIESVLCMSITVWFGSATKSDIRRLQRMAAKRRAVVLYEEVAEKYVSVVQGMYERSRTVVRCAVAQTEEFKVEVGLHQGSVLSPFLFAMVMDQLSEEVRQESPWTMMFADDIVICSESREQVEENLERWRYVLERRGMKRFQEESGESLAWDPGLGVETEEWKEHKKNLRKGSYKEDIQWPNLRCQTSTPYPENERREGRQPPEASEEEVRLLTKNNPSEGKDGDRKTSISTQYEENREMEPMERKKIPLNQEEEQNQCNQQEKKNKAEIEEEGKYHIAGVVTLTPTITELRDSEILRIREQIQGMRRQIDDSFLTMEDLKEWTQVHSSMELEEIKRRLRKIEQEMERDGNVRRQVEGAVKNLYDSHSEFLKRSQVESDKKEEDLHQLYQEVRKMREELDRRLSKTMDELKAVQDQIKEEKQQRAKRSLVISTMVTRSKKQRPEEEEEVKDGLPEYDEGRSEQAQGAAAQFPVMIKGNNVAYVPWSFLDLTGLIGRLPSICE